MSRSRSARTLQVLLRAETGVEEVELRWDSSTVSRGGWAWHVLWPDGPTEAAMRGHVRRLVRMHRLDLDPERLALARTVQPASVALAMVRNLRLGQPPLGSANSAWDFAAAAEAESHPERGTPEDVALAGHLDRLCRGLVPEMAAWLTRYGLDGLRREAGPAPANVIPLRRPR